MTGKDLIIYILKNNLEDVNISRNGINSLFMNIDEAATKFGVGTATLIVWFARGQIDCFIIDGKLYFLKDMPDPRKEQERNE